MNVGMGLILGGLLALASLSVYWEVQRERRRVGNQGQHFWLWASHCLSLTGAICSALMIASFALSIFVPEVAQRFGVPAVAMSAGLLIGFLGDRRNMRKK